ncbi:MAG: DUF2530 domain-containing protein [Candidatus Nanopelagicales bacterium]|nr:DUF2530 domain-containing protein [Candidatus Nanopelagicales bacterium]
MTARDPSQGTVNSAVAKPLDVDAVNATIVGTVAWFVALLVLVIFFRQTLAEHNATWWIWVCVAGTGLGLIGLPYVIRRRAVYRRHATHADEG